MTAAIVASPPARRVACLTPKGQAAAALLRLGAALDALAPLDQARLALALNQVAALYAPARTVAS